MSNKGQLTLKQMNFCKEYVSNGGIGVEAYLKVYNSNSREAARIEAGKLLNKEKIKEYIVDLVKPTTAKALTERERKKKLINERIAVCVEKNDDAAIARYIDILNRMDAEYVQVNHNIETKDTSIKELDTETLKKLTN